jgi:O-antigen/teichoic acid export membrane protein
VTSTLSGETSKLPWAAFARGVRDNLIAEVGGQGIRVCGVVILARLLSPDDFGVFRILMTASMFLILFSEAGIPDALIQRNKLNSAHESTAWWLTVALTGIFTSALYILSPSLERLMAMPDLSSGLRLLCVPSMLQGMSTIANARLRRQMRFSPLAISEVLAEVIFATTALLLVWCGRPRLSLPAGLAARIAAQAIFVLVAEPYFPRKLPQVAAAQDYWQFATVAFSGKLINVGANNVDFVLVGKLLGSTALGYYSIAWDLLRFVPSRLYRIAGRVALPAFARVQDQNQELVEAYRNLLDYIARFVLPVSGCVAVAAPELLSSIYGKQWLPAATPMRILVLGLTLAGVRIGIGTVFYAKSYPSLDIYLMSGRLASLTAIILLTAQHGLSAVSVGVSVVEGLISIAGQCLVCSLIHCRLGSLMSALIPGTWLAAACILATGAGKIAGMWLGIGPPLVLAFVTIPTVVVFFWLQAGDAARMITAAFKRAPDKAAQAF